LSAATIRSGANVGSVIGDTLSVREPQCGAADLDGQRHALRRRHRAMASDGCGVVPRFSALRGELRLGLTSFG
jgi:hypothetical protein